MTKRRYQSIDVKRMDWTNLGERIGAERLTVAVDVAKTNFMAALMKPDNEVLTTLRWQHPQETRLLEQGLLSSGIPMNRIDIVLEPTGVYGDSLRHRLGRMGMSIWRVNPKRVHDVAEVFDGVPSLHDAKSAYLIGRLHQEGASACWEELPESRRDDQALLAELELHQSEHRRNLNRLSALLSRHWPEAETFLALDRVSLHTLIAEFGDPKALMQQRTAARTRMAQVGKRFLDEDKIEGLLDSTQTTLGVPCTAEERAYLQTLARALLRTHAAINEVQWRIARRMESDPQAQAMAKTAGNATTLALQALLGSALNYPGARQYIKAAGLNLKERSSGDHHGKLKITKRGPPLVRLYLYFAALRWIQTDARASAWYETKVKQDGGLCGKAITGLMRRMLKGLWHVARGKTFDSSKLFGVIPKGGPVMAG